MPDVFATGVPGNPALHTELVRNANDNSHRQADLYVPISHQIQRGELKVKISRPPIKEYFPRPRHSVLNK